MLCPNTKQKRCNQSKVRTTFRTLKIKLEMQWGEGALASASAPTCMCVCLCKYTFFFNFDLVSLSQWFIMMPLFIMISKEIPPEYTLQSSKKASLLPLVGYSVNLLAPDCQVSPDPPSFAFNLPHQLAWDRSESLLLTSCSTLTFESVIVIVLRWFRYGHSQDVVAWFPIVWH